MSTDHVPEYPMPRAAGCPFDPPPLLKQLQEEAPLTPISVFGKPAWMITRYAGQRLLADPRLSSDVSRPNFQGSSPQLLPQDDRFGAGFIALDDPEHSRMRRMVTAPFTVKRVEALRPKVQSIVDRLIDDLLAGPNPADLMAALALPIPSLVICELLGVPYENHDFFQQNSLSLLDTTAGPADQLKAHSNLGSFLDELIGQKITNPGEDLLTDLAEQVRAGNLSRSEAAGNGLLMLVAGHETTANMIALGTLALLEHPDQFELLKKTDDPSAVGGAVEELLRYLNIAHKGRWRQVVEDIEFEGHTLKAGDNVVFANNIANRDPAVFADPDTLDLTRDARQHVAFGFGPHACLGQPLARMELKVVYHTLYHRIPTLRLAVPLEEIPFKHDATVYGVASLPVTW
ncbi:cytochrome P450 [Kribbella albertanoniae]|uniref:Cytochrome P450 n=1 Tax=Kribbella albertanoniae TaxID=1266829 RepID=A0A4R4QI97_9ACTN|nr:cytochrome P450 [Kribbella albertanoniae]TDC35481.1 cytochrome P450 [Kribbella albertanoniae]